MGLLTSALLGASSWELVLVRSVAFLVQPHAGRWQAGICLAAELLSARLSYSAVFVMERGAAAWRGSGLGPDWAANGRSEA